LAALLFAGCATAPMTVPGRVAAPGVPGIYHRVEKGQTLWRISRLYGVDLDELASINRIQDASNIENGQLIFIPRRNRTQNYRVTPDNQDFSWPLKGRVTAGFIQSGNNVNKGLNIQSATGTDIIASRGGRVVFCSQDFSGYGKTLIIDHGDGYSSVYSGVSQFIVNLGDSVQKGERIARSGYSLHFEIRKGYIAQNPYFYLS